ncbi:MAG: hypothetical protein PVS2B1_20430 [Candidatus Dormibacteraceae bacterium]
MESTASVRTDGIGLSTVFAVILGLALAMLALHALMGTPAASTPTNMGTTQNGAAGAEPIDGLTP